MSDGNDGGSAFPKMAGWRPTGNMRMETTAEYHETGMSLRDYFAGQALAGMSADPNIQGSWVEIADKAYFAADAMLLRRKS